ncbi:protein FAM136A-like [Tubulanus polymorphus]|uniref:protein FAM136A-like n=1 Tax=Tubulanus polymorphus TaxID=672921 RepID=UPI003DA64996
MDQAQNRVQTAVTETLNELDKTHLRKMQASMYRCSTKCCEDNYYSMEDVQRCLEQCSRPVQSAQQYIQGEMENFQNRLQRCAMDCQDRIRDKLGPNTSDVDSSKLRKEMEACVLKCADSHAGLLPNMMKKIKETLNKDYKS